MTTTAKSTGKLANSTAKQVADAANSALEQVVEQAEQAQTNIQQTAEEVQEHLVKNVKAARDNGKALAGKTQAVVAKHPLASLGIAFVAGAIVSSFARR